jgi:hypothetical protein
MALSFLPLRIPVPSYVSLPSVPFPLPLIPLPFVCAPLLSSLFPSRLLFLFCYARDILINLTHSTHTLLALYLLALYLLCTLYNCFALGLTRTDAVHGRGLRSRGVSRAEGAEGPGKPPPNGTRNSLWTTSMVARRPGLSISRCATLERNIRAQRTTAI